MVQQHFGGTLFFNRSWAGYKCEFGVPTRNYWIGNDKLYQLTYGASRYKLRVELQAAYDRQWYWAEYTTFKIMNETNKFQLNIAGYSGTAGDALKWANGAKFSTYDQHNENPSYACALDSIRANYAGFWYPYFSDVWTCGNAFINSPIGGTRGFGWVSLPFSNGDWSRAKLIASRMMLVPV